MCTMCSEAPVMAAAPITSLTDSMEDPGSTRPAAAHMGVNRHPALGGQTEHVDHFQPRGSRRVLNAHADGQAAGVQFRAQALFDSLICSGVAG